MNRKCFWAVVVVVLVLVFSLSASAEGELELGGRTAVTGNFSVTTVNPDALDKTTLIYFGSLLTRNTDDARFEYGIGLSVAGMLTDAGDISIVTPSAQVRVNSDLLGPEKNILAYVGFIGGVSILEINVDGGEDAEDEAGFFGPKFGAEYYFSSRVAVQLEDSLLFDTEKGITNNLTVGIKLLF